MKYYLAFDKGKGEKKDNADRYVIISLERFLGKDGFSRVSDVIDFTTKFRNYSDLFLTLMDNEVITQEYIGQPFTICYQGMNDKVWKHLGTNKFTRENKIIFQDDAYLVKKPDESELQNAYSILEQQRFLSVDQKYTIKFNITDELLSQELSIPRVWRYETASKEDQEHFDFLTKFTEEVRTTINAKKRTSAYAMKDYYAKFVNTIESYNQDLIKYLNSAQQYGDVDSRFFDLPIRKIVHTLCTKKNDNKRRMDVDLSELYNLATFYLNFYSNHKNTFKKETELLKASLEKLNKKTLPVDTNTAAQEEWVQLDFWGNEVPLSNYSRKRRK